MVVSDLINSPSFRLARVLNLLESIHGVTIDFDAAGSLDEIHGLREACLLERTRIIRESTYNSHNADPQYAQAVLIEEAIGIFLSEVAPKRIKRPTKTSA